MHENEGNRVGARSEADKLESSIMSRDNHDYVLREGRDVDSFFEEVRIRSAELEDLNGLDYYLSSGGANGRRLQSWSPGEVDFSKATATLSPYSMALHLISQSA